MEESIEIEVSANMANIERRDLEILQRILELVRYCMEACIPKEQGFVSAS